MAGELDTLYAPKKWFFQRLGEKCAEALKKNGFTVYHVATREEAVKIVLDEVPEGASVGIGGSVTVRELGLPEALKKRGHVVYDHWDPALSAAEKAKARENQVKADVFLSSANAITVDGTLVNTDGSGNRVGSMIFGPKISIVVAGTNKIVSDLEHAMERIRQYAAPVNYKRLGIEVPCQSMEDCADCTQKGCRVTTIIEAPPLGKEKFVVVLVGENLGY